MNWESVLEDWLRNIPIAIAGGAALAHVGFIYFVRQKNHEKQMEVAERAMKAFDAGANAIERSRPGPWDESCFEGPMDKIWAMKREGVLHSVSQRLLKQEHFFAEIEDVSNSAWLHLGPEAKNSLKQLLVIRSHIRYSVAALRKIPGPVSKDSDYPTRIYMMALFEDYAPEGWLKSGGGERNVSSQIKAARENLERTCEKFLSGLELDRATKDNVEIRTRIANSWKRANVMLSPVLYAILALAAAGVSALFVGWLIEVLADALQ